MQLQPPGTLSLLVKGMRGFVTGPAAGPIFQTFRTARAQSGIRTAKPGRVEQQSLGGRTRPAQHEARGLNKGRFKVGIGDVELPSRPIPNFNWSREEMPRDSPSC